MHQTFRLVCLTLLTCALVQCGLAQRRDPLTPSEVDQMRETADYPDKRLALMAGFAKARITSIEQLSADPKASKDRPAKIHDLLQDFTSLLYLRFIRL